jgi:hypothetical protein
VTNILYLDDPSISKIWKIFEANVKNQLINVERFQKQGKEEGKVNNTYIGEAPHSLTKIEGPPLYINKWYPLQRGSCVLSPFWLDSHRRDSIAARSRGQYSSG